uniref:Enoyl-CoA delta isomerase 2, mitochondrial n=1 Tax=Phallusia mammillata TaxID=59560 RepID=A0A6F9DAV4_9ASCI|nr:enoyl-CoA delta isomerase 2, mitochondrial [Phallusia mammillata]
MGDESRFVNLEKFEDYAIIRWNKPQRKNGLTLEMQAETSNHLKSIANDDNIKFVVITGTGEYFTSGADFISSAQSLNGTSEAELRSRTQHFRSLIETLIRFPKPIIAAVNGPSIGMGVTILPLCDVVYCSDNSTFMTPFSRLGLTAEGCSSYTFPKVMGYSKANDVLLFNRQLSAQEAYHAGLVAQVFPKQTFWTEVQKRIDDLVQYPINSYIYGKQLIRLNDMETLFAVNHRECERLIERYGSEEFVMQVMKFVQKRQLINEQRKSKL